MFQVPGRHMEWVDAELDEEAVKYLRLTQAGA